MRSEVPIVPNLIPGRKMKISLFTKILTQFFDITFYTVLLFLFASCTSESKATSIAARKIEVADTIKEEDEDPLKDLGFKEIKLVKIIQSKVANPKEANSVYESAINSPKSVIYSKDGKKFYVNSLEGYTTVVFDSRTFKKIKEIRHKFNAENNKLFKNNENTVFDYQFKQKKDEYNHFMGKPVESCLSHEGKYLWVTYYRRDWDPNAESPSAVAIIDTEKDEIVRVMPSGPLPKMVACSGDNKYVAVTHWGDNTVGLIDVSSEDPMDFRYVSHIVVDNRLAMNFAHSVNRDNSCGNCLRGTVFSPDNKKILIAKMGGNGIAVIDVESKEYLGTITGSYLNLRHLVINQGDLVLSSNSYGMVQKAKLDDILSVGFNEQKQLNFKGWQSISVGPGARTIDITENGKYIFACVNNACKVAVVDAKTMTKLTEIDAAPFPVGMALSPDNKQLIITSQGKEGSAGSGNTVMVFELVYDKVAG